MTGRETREYISRLLPSKWRNGAAIPTYYVSQLKKKGFYQRIQEAVESVPPNSRIEIVGGGTFCEAVVIRKPLELGVNKNSATPTLTFRSTVLTLRSDNILVEGISIHTESMLPAVVISDGSPTMQHCSIKGLEVCGTATPTVEDCSFSGFKGHAIFLRQQSGGYYTRNWVSSLGGFCVMVESTGKTMFSFNTICNSLSGRVCIRSPSTEDGIVEPQFSLNRLIDETEESNGKKKQSGAPGIESQSSSMTLNMLAGLPVKQTGMRVHLLPAKIDDGMKNNDDDLSNPLLADESSGESGFVVTGANSQPQLSQNTVNGSHRHGLVIKEGAGGVYSGNYFVGSKSWGILITDNDSKMKSIPVLTSNQISANGGGIKINRCPVHIKDHNVIFGNLGPQIFIDGGHPDLLVDECDFRSSPGTAILCKGNGGGMVSGSEFDNCRICVRLDAMAEMTFKKNTFDGCDYGVEALNGARSEFIECVFSDLTKVGAFVHHSAQPAFRNCSFLSCCIGIQIAHRARGFFKSCTIQDCAKTGIEISDFSYPEFRNCVIRDGNGANGVLITQHSGGKFVRNQIIRHRGSTAVSVAENADPIFVNNVIGLMEHSGLWISRGGCGLYLNNLFFGCLVSSVVITGPGSGAVLRQNYIVNSGRQGLLMYDSEGSAVCEKNIFIGSGRSHVLLSINDSLIFGSVTEKKNVNGDNGKRELSQTVASPRFIPGTREVKPPFPSLSSLPTLRTPASTFTQYMTLRENAMLRSNYAGIIVEGNIFASLKGNIISQAQQGVLLYGDGHVVMMENQIERCEGGLTISDDVSADVVGNVFQKIMPGSAIATVNSCKSAIAFNSFLDCHHGLYLRSCLEEIIVFSNIFCRSTKVAIFMNPNIEKRVQLCKNAMKDNARDTYVYKEEE